MAVSVLYCRSNCPPLVGFAFVQMKVAKDVKPALAFHETTFRNRALRVFRASDQKAKSGAARRIAGKIKPGKQSLKKAQRSAPGPRSAPFEGARAVAATKKRSVKKRATDKKTRRTRPPADAGRSKKMKRS